MRIGRRKAGEMDKKENTQERVRRREGAMERRKTRRRELGGGHGRYGEGKHVGEL